MSLLLKGHAFIIADRKWTLGALTSWPQTKGNGLI